MAKKTPAPTEHQLAVAEMRAKSARRKAARERRRMRRNQMGKMKSPTRANLFVNGHQRICEGMYNSFIGDDKALGAAIKQVGRRERVASVCRLCGRKHSKKQLCKLSYGLSMTRGKRFGSKGGSRMTRKVRRWKISR